MSSSRAIKPRRSDTVLTGWESVPEHAPSIVREEQPTLARFFALAGLGLILLGIVPVVGPLMGIANPLLTAGPGFMCVTLGLCLVLFHAFVDRERVFRRFYASLGLFSIAAALLLRVWPTSAGMGAYFPYAGFPALFLGLVLLIATVRLEAEKSWRTILINILGGVGAVMVLAGVGVGLFARLPNFLPGEGAFYLIVGLLYFGAFIAQQESEDIAFYAGLALGAAGLVAFGGGLLRSQMAEGSLFLVPNGLILMGAGALYLVTCAGICLDWPIVVLTRRELASYFYSPIAYLILLGMLLVGWYMFWQLLISIVLASVGLDRPMFEPIVAPYIFELFPVIVQIFVIPALTMRLLAEEQRTGTLEVLLTAPVNETTIVVSKFLAAWAFYLLTWMPWWLNLVALRYVGGTEFDYRPLLSFNLALLAIGAGFIAMGLFFSSLTRNQIIAAVLTFVGMLGHLALYIVKFRARLSPGDVLYDVITYASFLDLWQSTLEGNFAPKLLMFHLSAAVFFLFATVKVLEARKWK
jgi:ABC-2 type transport system permease protein